MTKDSEKKNKDETTDKTQEEMLQGQYEFGLHEDVRKKLEDEEDSHKEPADKADEDDEIISKDED